MSAAITVLAATSYVYLINEDAQIHWWIPIVALITAIVMKTYPASWRLHSDVEPKENAMG
jgi:uncharacterized membrane protein